MGSGGQLQLSRATFSCSQSRRGEWWRRASFQAGFWEDFGFRRVFPFRLAEGRAADLGSIPSPATDLDTFVMSPLCALIPPPAKWGAFSSRCPRVNEILVCQEQEKGRASSYRGGTFLLHGTSAKTRSPGSPAAGIPFWAVALGVLASSTCMESRRSRGPCSPALISPPALS